MQDREALIAATVEMAAQAAYQWWGMMMTPKTCAAISALSPATQTDALEAVRREAQAEGMRMAADLFTGSIFGRKQASVDGSSQPSRPPPIASCRRTGSMKARARPMRP